VTRRAALDDQASELDAALPPSTAALLQGHEPVYQRPRERRGRGLVTAVVSVALIAAGALLMFAPISATTAVASWVGSR
jgi:hypothetical protein